MRVVLRAVLSHILLVCVLTVRGSLAHVFLAIAVIAAAAVILREGNGRKGK